MANKKPTKAAARGRRAFKATYTVLIVQPPTCGPRTCVLSLCGSASIQCDEYSLVQLVARNSREAREILGLVREIRRLTPRLGIVITGKPADIRRIESGLKRP